jgi:hypothetical protein
MKPPEFSRGLQIRHRISTVSPHVFRAQTNTNILVVLSLDVVRIIWQKTHLMFKYVLGADSNSHSE